jgi:hypothetical protein
MKWAGHDLRNAHKILIANPEGKKALERPRRKIILKFI